MTEPQKVSIPYIGPPITPEIRNIFRLWGGKTPVRGIVAYEDGIQVHYGNEAEEGYVVHFLPTFVAARRARKHWLVETFARNAGVGLGIVTGILLFFWLTGVWTPPWL